MSSYNKLDHRNLCISNDFGKGFVFSDEQSVRISEKEFEGYSSGESHRLDETYNGSSLLVFSGGLYPKVLRLRRSIPTFDSGDREYDSWHELYLVQENNGHIHAVYATGGYRIAGIEKIPDVLEYPEALKQYLRQNPIIKMSKEQCNQLRDIRRKIAEKNNIPYNPKECAYSGDDCTGTCPQCDIEVKYLENELKRRKAMRLPVFTIEGEKLDDILSGEPLTLDTPDEDFIRSRTTLMGIPTIEL